MHRVTVTFTRRVTNIHIVVVSGQVEVVGFQKWLQHILRYHVVH
jgi:acylphosphatase